MKQISLLAILCCITSIVLAQKKIDGVVAIVGEKIVLQSAVESQLEQIVIAFELSLLTKMFSAKFNL